MVELRQVVGLLVLLLGVVVAACGSGGEPAEPSQTATTRSDRVARQATVMQQTTQQADSVTEAPSDAQPAPDSQAEDVAADVEAEDEQDAPVAASPSGLIDFGHREGLPFNRNVIGDPEASVVIVEYSDYQ